MHSITRGLVNRSVARRVAALTRDDDGMATAEYAVGTVAACGFGGILYKILTSEAVGGLVTDLISRALGSIFG